MSKQAGAIAAGIGLLIGAWAFGYYVAGGAMSASGSVAAPASQVSVRAVPQTQTNEGEARSAAVNTPAVTLPMRYKTYAADMSGDSTRACFSFTKPLDVSLANYSDYFDVKPATKLAARASSNDLCLSGFDYAKDYTITFKAGLPHAGEGGLESDTEVSLSFGDKPAVVKFAGDGIILPRIGAQGLGIETVNVDTLTAQVYRVNDRIISQRDPQSGEITGSGEYFRVYQNAATEVREEIWSGEIDVSGKRNQSATTVLPLSDLIGTLKPGAYVVAVQEKMSSDDNNARPAQAWRWVISTDLALTAYDGTGGLSATVRSIDTALPQSGTRVTLIAKNNDLLGEAVSDKFGRVSFPAALSKGEGPAAPSMLMAYGAAGDYALLDLSRAPLDLSDRNIAGRSASGPIDVYAYADRGVYRPGETANLTFMMRGSDAGALDRDVTLKFLKPNGLEAKSLRITETLAGTIIQAFDIPASAPRGVWTAKLYVDGASLAGAVEFSVEDFVPQKIAVEPELSAKMLTPKNKANLTVKADFLYGAPGADLEAEADMRVRIDPSPFADFKAYSFGDETERFREKNIELGTDLTNAKGVAAFEIDLSREGLSSSYPLRADITVGVQEPGGRYIQNSLRAPLRTTDLYLGIKPGFEGRRARRNAQAPFSLIGLDAAGKAVATSNVMWELIEEDWDYHWYRQNGRWRYRRDTRDIPLQAGSVDLTEAGAEISMPALGWGHYRLVVTQAETGAQSSKRFSVGWAAAGSSQAPDQLSVAGPQGPVKVGDTVTLTINAPYAGMGELVIAGREIHSIRQVKLAEGGSQITIPVDKSWGTGAYALLTLYTPRSASARPVPRRAVGVAYIPVDAANKTINVSVEAPDVVRPRGMQTIDVSLSGVLSGQNYLTLAAVDEGILRITKYESPSPEDYFFGKKALAMAIYDDYGRLLNPNLGDAAMARSGGDSLGGEGLTAVPVKIVSLFSGPIAVKNGKARIPVSLPDFNGQVRLMAVAWNKKAVGSDVASMIVRDAVPADLTLPRFMAPGDTAQASLTLDNVEGKAGIYKTAITASGSLSLSTAAPAFKLTQGQRETQTAGFKANATGVTQITMDVSGPGKYGAQMTYPFEVRSGFRPVTTQVRKRLKPGEHFAANQTLIAGLEPLSADAHISFAYGPNLDPSAYAASLARYPYGCTEQTASSGMPLLYAKDIGGIPGFDVETTKYQMQAAVDKLLGRLSSDGAFGLWREGDGYSTAWVGAYATEFIQRAEAEGFDVPENGLKTAYKGLSQIVAMRNYPSISYDYGRGYSDWNGRYRAQRSSEAAAYAHYVLARAGRGDLSKMRYFFDNQSGEMKTSLSYGHIGAALSMMGDNIRSKRAFEFAVDALGYQDQSDYYQSALRDTAGLIAIFDEVEYRVADDKVLAAFEADLKDPSRLHTQEKVRVVMAIRALMKGSAPILIDAKNATLTGGNRADLLASDLSETPVFTNAGDEDILVTASISGTPILAPEAMSNGITISKAITDTKGNPVDVAKINRGDRLIISLEFASEMNRSRQIVMADLLPAGVEIETILQAKDGKGGSAGAQSPYAFLGKISDFDVTEARDDRFIASLKTNGRRTYRAAYIVRAVTAGDFLMPGAVIEDMYRPADQALTKASRMRISLKPEG